MGIAVGCSGTGKTLTGFHFGMDYLASGHFEKFVYVRSDVGTEFQRGRGAIKGDYGEKFMPLLTPLIDNASLVFRNRGAFEYLINKGIIEGVFLEDIRGRTFNNCFVLADEMQNTTVNQAKTIITRIGKNSKLALIGDTSQSDLKEKKKKEKKKKKKKKKKKRRKNTQIQKQKRKKKKHKK